MYYTKSKPIAPQNTTTLENLIDAFFPKVYRNTSIATSSAKPFPPHNIIELNEGNDVAIELALAGYDPNDISVYVEKDQLVIEYTKTSSTEVNKTNYIYKGISEKSFKKTFSLGEQWEVTEKAKWENGMLRITISKIAKNVPERKLIEIQKQQKGEENTQ
jgi:molecular chaperone IbpA